jgi:hypothetical protein
VTGCTQNSRSFHPTWLGGLLAEKMVGESYRQEDKTVSKVVCNNFFQDNRSPPRNSARMFLGKLFWQFFKMALTKKRHTTKSDVAKSLYSLSEEPELVLANMVSYLDIQDAGRLCTLSKKFNCVIKKNNSHVVGIAKFRQFLDGQLKLAVSAKETVLSGDVRYSRFHLESLID